MTTTRTMKRKFPARNFWHQRKNDAVLRTIFEIGQEVQPLNQSTKIWKVFFKLFYRRLHQYEKFSKRPGSIYNYTSKMRDLLEDISGQTIKEFKNQPFIADDWMAKLDAARDRLHNEVEAVDDNNDITVIPQADPVVSAENTDDESTSKHELRARIQAMEVEMVDMKARMELMESKMASTEPTPKRQCHR